MVNCARRHWRFGARLDALYLACAFGALFFGCAPSSDAQASSAERRPPASELMQGVSSSINYQETSISPNHRYVAWVEGQPASSSSTVFCRAIERGASVVPVTAKLTAGPATSGAIKEKDIAWSPDSASVAFLSDARSPGQMQLYVMSVKDASVRQLTQLKGFLATPHWSPSGRQIAFLFTENAVREAGPLAAAAPAEGVIDDQVYEQRIANLDLTSHEVKQVSPADLYVYQYDWSPDGTQFVATAAQGSGDNNWYVAEIYTFNAVTGAARSLFKPSMQIAVPRWSPDGRSIAFIGGLMSDEGIASGDLYLMPAAGGEPRNLTPALQGSAYWLAWRANSRDIFFAEAIDGGSGLAELNIKTGLLKIRWKGEQTVTAPEGFAFGISLASDGETSALIRESFNEPKAVWSGHRRPRPGTRPGAKHRACIGRAMSFRCKGGWFHRPRSSRGDSIRWSWCRTAAPRGSPRRHGRRRLTTAASRCWRAGTISCSSRIFAAVPGMGNASRKRM
jgi:Tol biopolymer transport system component